MTDEIHPYDPHEHEPMPEGEEEAPRFTHTMAIVRWIILGGMTLFALIMILSYFGLTPGSGAAAGPTQYHCPMHPTYVANQPGDCPICGMSLVPIDAAGKETSSTDTGSPTTHQHEGTSPSAAKPGQYTCPMHPEVISDTAGRCPDCKMYLEPVSNAARPGQYTCPMDPEVISDAAGECPKCGMDLELVPESADSTHAQHSMSDMGSAPVPGLVPISIESQRLQLIGVRTGTAERRSLDHALHLVGFVTPDETQLSDIHVRFNGWVKELHVNQTGQQVKMNDRLLSVYSQDLYQAEQEYLVARRAMTSVANDDLMSRTRKQLLAASRERLLLLGIPSDELARLDSSNTARAELWVRSPFTGYVLEKNVVSGQFIGPDQSLFTVADLRKIWILADVYEQDLAAIRVGQTTHLTTSAFPDEAFEGVVSFVYPSLSEQTRTMKVRIEIANPDFHLRPGMYAEIDVDLPTSATLAIPADAVMDGGNLQYAFVVHNGTHFEPRLLKVGRKANDWIEILSGLAEGEQVVTSANFLIDSESRLKAAIAGMGGVQPDSHAGHGK